MRIIVDPAGRDGGAQLPGRLSWPQDCLMRIESSNSWAYVILRVSLQPPVAGTWAKLLVEVVHLPYLALPCTISVPYVCPMQLDGLAG